MEDGRAVQVASLNVDPVEIAVIVLEDGQLLLDEWDLRRVFNVPQWLFDLRLQDLITERLRALAQPVAFTGPKTRHRGTGFAPPLLTALSELLLNAWEDGRLEPADAELVETAALLYWRLAGAGADPRSREVFGAEA